jgi:type I restriction enzyme S subunit
MQLLQHFKELTIRPKNAKELKSLILQLAVQGKLTENWRAENPDVESANILIKKILRDKERLIKLKKSKQKKHLSHVSEKEKPFNLPKSWVWCRLGDISDLPYGKGLSKKDLTVEGYYVFGANGIIGKYSSYLYEDEQLLISCRGAYSGKTNISPKKCFVTSNSLVCEFFNTDLTFYKYFFYSITALPKEKIVSGSAQPQVTATNALPLPIALPPLEEQKEIVKVVETLFKEVEQLEQLTVDRISLKEDFVTSALNQLITNNAKQEWVFLQNHFKSFFNETTNIKKLRETVLQLAVQGKLTADWRANNPDTEDASILLKRIQKEKAQLIKDKKIKKEKPLPPIAKEEIPYELPEGWVWCRLGEISSVRVGATPKRDIPEYWNGNIPWVSSGEVANNFILDTKEKITDKGLSKSSVTIYPIGTVLVAMIGQGKTRGQTSILKINAGTNQNVGGIIIFHDYLISEYLWQFFLGRYEKTRSNAVGGNQPAINGTKLKMSVFGLPPLEEQKAIVQKVNALMGLCDKLEQEIQQSQEHSGQLMQSCLKEVFEPNNLN